jgi:hypothetical protein
LVIGPEKSNVAAGTPASRFRIESVQVFPPTEDSDGTVPRLVWIGDAEQSARDFFVETAEVAEPSDRTERDEAGDWLESYLAAKGGRAPRQDVLKAARASRFSERTIKRAASERKIVSERHGFPAVATWALPEGHPGHQSGQPQLGQVGHRLPERGPTVSIGRTDDDQHRRNGHRGPTEGRQPQLGHDTSQLGQLGQPKKTGPTVDTPSWANGNGHGRRTTGDPTTCLVCGEAIDPAAGTIHPQCELAAVRHAADARGVLAVSPLSSICKGDT